MRQTFDSLSFTLFGCPLDTDNGVCRLAVFIKLICKLYAKLCAQCYIVICCLSALVINNTADPCCPVNVIAQNLENCAFKLCFACSVNLADGYAVSCVAKQNIILAIIKLMRSFYTFCYLAVLNCECYRSGKFIACRSSCFSQCICAVIKILDLHVLVSHGCPLEADLLCIISFIHYSFCSCCCNA